MSQAALETKTVGSGSLSEQYFERIRAAELAELDATIAELEPTLVSLTDKVLDIHRLDPFSSILVEDCSARFAGLFVSRALALFSDRLDTFFVKKFPYREMPQFADLGDPVLVVTDVVSSGDHLREVLNSYTEPNRRFTIASCLLKFESTGDDLEKEYPLQIISANDTSYPDELVHGNAKLNGVKVRVNRETSMVLPEAAVYHINGSLLYYEPGRHRVVKHGRERLRELVEKYTST